MDVDGWTNKTITKSSYSVVSSSSSNNNNKEKVETN